MKPSFSCSGASCFRAWARLLVVVSAVCAWLPASRAAAPEAIAGYQLLTFPTVGLLSGGGGFAFTPETNIVVTSLGFGGAALADEPYRVSLWDTNGSRLAQVVVTPSSRLRNGTYYEPVQRLELSAGVNYFLSAAGAESGEWSGYVVSTAVAPVDGTFTVGPALSYLASALGTNADGTFPANQWANTFLFVGANFEYATPPVILLSGVAVAGGQAQVDFTVTGGPASSFILLEAEQPVGAWVTNANAMLTTKELDAQYTFTSAQQGEVRFFRVLGTW